ncbi:hypothetical protein BDV27DRAFT_154930 [Aspergillus caelatus]|uniref:Uncharacterized protein n=1 Tax=Aspergillus caelatus TaxID=61420 RepID=A0A5N7AC84_9EURO|nr:uncharacterized protein BDV27DRAFT_154930 [Aspergillus caelatus]KAE8367497.1 hypothetical protein BDV27DRAFT_154930 [Aspergillus caelatus]
MDDYISHFLTSEEKNTITRQFQGDSWRPNRQVLWTGIPKAHAQRWAEKHGMQTLTTAMGPLMAKENGHCLFSQKGTKGWSRYIKGASALFAWHICGGEEVTVLTPPPPFRFHPSGFTSYQVIEEPILKGGINNKHVSIIMLVHPDVKGAEDFRYQIWPVDKTSSWIAKFGSTYSGTRCWREVKMAPLVHGANGQNLLLPSPV